MRVWRITTPAHAGFDGEGARQFGSRWTPRGIPAVFTSATLSLAALERFVHTDTDLGPASLVAISVDSSEYVAFDSVEGAHLSAAWRSFRSPSALIAMG